VHTPGLALGVHIEYTSEEVACMPAIRVGVREFRERIATFLESDKAYRRHPSRGDPRRLCSRASEA